MALIFLKISAHNAIFNERIASLHKEWLHLPNQFLIQSLAILENHNLESCTLHCEPSQPLQDYWHHSQLGILPHEAKATKLAKSCYEFLKVHL